MSSFQSGALVLNRYTVLSVLGAGGMATVYRARDSQTNQEVALKVLNSDQAAAPEKCARFIQEFTLLSRLKNPAIVEVYEQHTTEQGEPFFSMKLVHGQTLATLLEESKTNSGPLSLAQAHQILTGVAEALCYLHSKRIVYCDLKPANILVEESGNIILVDFGISQEIPPSAADGENKAMVGTSYYLSPEQIRGEVLDQRADIYAFGVLAFELLTGHVPFVDPSLFTITASHLAAKVPSTRTYNRDVNRTFDRMIHICMAKDKNDRYESMEEVLDRLKSATLATKNGPWWLSWLSVFR